MRAVEIDTAHILAARPPRHHVDPWTPHAFFLEEEYSAAGTVDEVAALFLTNSECPFKCLFCDLWKNTTVEPTPPGAIPAQIDRALEKLSRMTSASVPRHIKLYNSGNFFDRRAIPPDDYRAIADRVRQFQTVIVENHPRLCGEECLRFRDLISPAELEVAMGLETVHTDVLRKMNKGMTVDDFATAAELLRTHAIAMRAFVLLRPPFLDEASGIVWALRSIDFAFDQGVGCCSVIPTRSGNGMLDRLASEGLFAPPKLSSLETVVDTALGWGRGRVFADLWDAERFGVCSACTPARIGRLAERNRTQQPIPPETCPICGE